MESTRDTLEREGLVLIPRAVREQDRALVEEAVDRLIGSTGEGVVETPEGELQSVYGIHRRNPELLGVVQNIEVHLTLRELFGEPYYVFQSQLHLKPRSSSALPWHQDSNAFHKNDGLPRSRGFAVIVLADRIEPHHGPMFLIPRSHRDGILPSEQTALRFAVAGVAPDDSRATQFSTVTSVAEEMARKNGVITLTGDAGDVALMDLDLIHASCASMLDQRRALLHFSLVGTRCRAARPRPGWIVDPDGHPLF